MSFRTAERPDCDQSKRAITHRVSAFDCSLIGQFDGGCMTAALRQRADTYCDRSNDQKRTFSGFDSSNAPACKQTKRGNTKRLSQTQALIHMHPTRKWCRDIRKSLFVPYATRNHQFRRWSETQPNALHSRSQSYIICTLIIYSMQYHQNYN